MTFPFDHPLDDYDGTGGFLILGAYLILGVCGKSYWVMF